MNQNFLTLDELEDKLRELLTVDDLADKLKVKKSWVYSRSRETGPGAMPKIKVGKYLRFELEQVMEWLKAQNEVD